MSTLRCSVVILCAVIFNRADALLLCYAYFGFVDDFGWTYSQNVARQAVDARLGSQSKYIEGVHLSMGADFPFPSTPAQEAAYQSFIDDGCDFIISGSSLLGSVTKKFANKYLDKYFLVIGGLADVASLPNAATVFCRLYQARYVAGVAAASTPGVTRLGYVGSLAFGGAPIPESARDINAFFLGARSVNPNIELDAIYTNSWFAPREEEIAGIRLWLNYNVSAVTYDSDSDTTCATAKALDRLPPQESPIFAIGNKMDCGLKHSSSSLTSTIYQYDQIIEELIRVGLDGTWNDTMPGLVTWHGGDRVKDQNALAGFEKNAIGVGAFSQFVPFAAKSDALSVKETFANGIDKVFCPGSGTFKDNHGQIHRIADDPLSKNGCFSDAYLFNDMTWLPEGVHFHGALDVPLTCPPGTYKDPLEATLCISCVPGKFSSVSEQTACAACALGTYMANSGATVCMACLPGMKQGREGQIICDACEKGKFSNGIAASCTACPVGTFRDQTGGKLVTSCHFCERGKYASQEGSTTCQTCGDLMTTQDIAANSREHCVCNIGTFLNLETCVRCPAGSTTAELGSTHVRACFCEKGTYMPAEPMGDCRKCEEGMECELGSAVANFPPPSASGRYSHTNASTRLAYPKTKMGYYTKESDPLHVYRCRDNAGCACPGGEPGVCNGHRSGLVCHDCPTGKLKTTCGCMDCTEGHYISFVAVIIVAVGGATIVYHVIDKEDPVKQRLSTLMVGMVLGQFITLTQQMAILDTLAVSWASPFNQFLDFMTLFIFDFEAVNANCIGKVSPVTNFALRIFLVIVLFGILAPIHLVFACFRHKGKFRERTNTLIAVTGVIFMTFFISISTSVLSPFRCQYHPNGELTIRDYDTVYCWQGDEDHTVMVIFAAFGAQIPVFFLTWVGLAIWRYPRVISRGNTNFLRANAFLFVRFRKETYWYAIMLLSRNLLLALIPVLPNVVLQIILFLAVVLPSIASQAFFVPWRLTCCNALEVFSLVGMASLVACAAFFVEPENVNTTAIATVCIIVVLVMVVILLFAFAFSISARLLEAKRGKRFSQFLCHYKAGAGSFARLLKVCLVQKGAGRTFLDSDDLQDISMLFGYVQYETMQFVILCSQGILMRKWCVGEMNAARIGSITTIIVKFPNFTWPVQEFIDSYEAYNPDIMELAQFGVSIDMVRETFRSIKGHPKLVLPGYVDSEVMGVITDRLRLSTADKLIELSASEFVRRNSFDRKSRDFDEYLIKAEREQKPSEKMIVADMSWSESASTACIIEKLLLPRTLFLGPDKVPIVLGKGETLPSKTTQVIMVCSTGCFLGTDFIRALFRAGELRVELLPVICEEAFRFPTPAFFESLDRDVAHLMMSLNETEDEAIYSSAGYAELIEKAFGEIAVVIHPADYSSTTQVLDAKATAVATRLTTKLNRLQPAQRPSAIIKEDKKKADITTIQVVETDAKAVDDYVEFKTDDLYI